MHSALSLFFAPLVAVVVGDNCTLCPDGRQPPEPNRTIVNDDVFGNTTCGALTLSPEFTGISNETVCANSQSFWGVGVCGCDAPTAACSLCPDRSEPSKLDFEVTGTNNVTFSCQQLYDEAPLFPRNSSTCESIQLAWHTCGCPAPEGSCTLCKDGSFPGDPDARVVDLNTGYTYTCEQLFESAGLVPTDRCDAFQQNGITFCMCPDPNNPDPGSTGGSCDLCVDQTSPPNPDFEVIDGRTCRDFAEAASLDVPNCAAYQAAVGVYCSCDSNSVVAAEHNTCRICSNETLLPDPNRTSTGGDATCLELEFEANSLEGALCEEYQRDHGAACGCPGYGGPNGSTPTSTAASRRSASIHRWIDHIFIGGMLIKIIVTVIGEI